MLCSLPTPVVIDWSYIFFLKATYCDYIKRVASRGSACDLCVKSLAKMPAVPASRSRVRARVSVVAGQIECLLMLATGERAARRRFRPCCEKPRKLRQKTGPAQNGVNVVCCLCASVESSFLNKASMLSLHKHGGSRDGAARGKAGGMECR